MAILPTERAVQRRADEVTALAGRIGPRFARSETRDRAAGYLRALLSDAERKNGWQVAERIGDATPDGVQFLLARAGWDADAVRDDLTRYVAETLGSPDGVPVVDETGFLKKGTKSCGVARQYSGTAGRIENCQVGVFLGYGTGRGRALIDRALYLPKAWAGDPARRAEAGVPAAVAFATKVAQARAMIGRAGEAGVPPRWVMADAVYGSDSQFRATAETHGLGSVVAVRSDFTAWVGGRPERAKALLAEVPAGAWRRLSCGDGAKGPRVYDWAWRPASAPGGAGRWLLGRQSVSDPSEVAYFACGGPPGTTLADLVRVAGARWAIEECFELARGECGLDESEVRGWTGWHRHVTLSLLALAAVAAIRAKMPRPRRSKKASGS